MARRYLSVLLLLLCTACATPHDLVRVPGVQPEQVCDYLQEAGYDPGWCFFMDSGQMREAIQAFQKHQQLKPANGRVNGETWLRLNTVVRSGRKLKESQAKPTVNEKSKRSPSPAASSAAKQPSAITPPAKAKPAPGPAPTAKPAPKPQPPLAVGQQVLVAERTKCLPRSGAWMLAYVGAVRSLEGEKVLVTLSNRISYRFNPSAKGVDNKDWFCVPRRRHCYSTVPFGDWGGTHRPGEAASFDKTRVRRLSGDTKDALHDLAHRFCR